MKFNFYTNQFEEKEKTPSKIALVGSNGELSWQELFERTQTLVEVIKNLDLEKGYPIFIYGHKEVEFPISILACLITQHPFVPIDRLYPKKRIEEIKAETQSSVFIDCSGELEDENATVISFESGEINKKSGAVTESCVPVFQENPLAYILFTSGSTGKPKGVMIRKNSILDLVNWIDSDAFGMTENEVFVNQSPFSFDVSLFDTFATLTYGATMIMVSQELAKNTEEFHSKLATYKATFWTSTPSFIYLYLRENWFNSEALPSLKKFLFAGEPLPIATCQSLFNQFTEAQVANAYGPTEATVITTIFDIDESTLGEYSNLPIGYSKPDSEMITLESSSKESPKELIIVGENVAEGYLNRSKQTEVSFFSQNSKKAYKTGDLGYIENGLIYCMGRIDNQIKLNGYRIELDEINEKILAVPNVDEARTIGLKRNDKVVRIVSLFQSSTEIDVSSIKERLVKSLPHYMVPSDIHQVPDFPKNQSGKIDGSELQEFYLEQKKLQKK